MREIRKNATCPTCLSDFIASQQKIGPPVVNLTYSSFQNPGRQELREILTHEQFGLCGYTGAPVDDRISNLRSPNQEVSFSNHIEHLKCQKTCKKELANKGLVYGEDLGEDLDYNNLIAALEVRGAHSEQFGAVYKGNSTLSVWPTHERCSERFRFREGDGGVDGLNAEGCHSIDILNLKHETLMGWRKGAIDAFFNPEVSLTRQDLEIILQKMEGPVDGRLPEFAFVISNIARQYLTP
ncbi:MAG TPA: hypothetical protein EYP19_11265 [Desulfobacterales bacterium]|nr:hypothetical protein [Desulfobacterales bacterium]